eukprot:CAMPEP_0197702940 /NCGR_PEP_ID=MMETSP1338-20131121/125148_1 /TAXON_ID=43686 ORGANISM="Pelagodinium beii, Strain RCC1491" /NCGR_SAMPLE_ID=MMETSP1338 /ASSEMBLY_ACC=CAM_ASM_000754 /LENGTH=148 /DNA_ID=CAMNT_0043286827 /DNA_START=16 /DNA_END=463 /DNA_ORIENTATION=-
MPQEIQLKLVFANDHNSTNFTVALNTSVKDVKGLILQKHWPSSPSLMPAAEVGRLRLFAAGKELGGKGSDDAKSLKDLNIVASQHGPTPVHVMAVQKEADAEKPQAASEELPNKLRSVFAQCSDSNLMSEAWRTGQLSIDLERQEASS